MTMEYADAICHSELGGCGKGVKLKCSTPMRSIVQIDPQDVLLIYVGRCECGSTISRSESMVPPPMLPSAA